MKTLNSLLPVTAFAILTGISLLSSCKKENEEDKNAAKYEATADMYFNDIKDISDQVADKGDLSGLRMEEDQSLLVDNCAIITIDTSANVSPSNPDTLIIDFGSGCTGSDGKLRAGKIVVSATGKYREAGTVVTIRSLNYSVDGNVVSGFKKVTNNGTNANGQPTANVHVDGSVALANNGGTITRLADHDWTWTAGYQTPYLLADDEVSLSGTSSGTGPNGSAWSTVINVPLLYKRICHQIVSGTITITPATTPEILVDFGQGLCDNTLTATINKKTYTIVVK